MAASTGSCRPIRLHFQAVPDAPTARDGCVVPTEPLAAMIGSFVREWRRTRPDTRGQFKPAASPGPVTLTAYDWLHLKTGVPKRSLENIAAGRYPTTELRVADLIVSAIGRPEAFYNGTLEVRPNPLAARAAQAACCGTPSFAGSGGLSPALDRRSRRQL